MRHPLKNKHSPRRAGTEKGGFYLQNILYMALLICVLALGVRLINGMGSPMPLETAVLEYVIDGDTVNVTVDGEDVRVRLIGINTPESVSQTEENTPEGKAASRYLRDLLHPGDQVYLEYDVRQYDDYGRTLAYIWLSPSADLTSYDDFCRYNLSAVIYQHTYCELMNIPPNDKYCDWFKRLTPAASGGA